MLRRRKPLPPLAGRQFKTLNEVVAEVQRIRKESPLGVTLWGADLQIAQEWMSTHYGYESKVQKHGCLKRIVVRYNPLVPNEDKRQFRLIFEDESEHEFSYKADRNAYGFANEDMDAFRLECYRKRLDTVMRQLIVKDVTEHKSQVFHGVGVCEHSGAPLTEWDDTVVHHDVFSFKKLSYWFLYGLKEHLSVYCEDISVISTDNCGGKTFEDERFSEWWVEYHLQHWQPLVVTKAAHYEIHSAKEVEPPWRTLYRSLATTRAHQERAA